MNSINTMPQLPIVHTSAKCRQQSNANTLSTSTSITKQTLHPQCHTTYSPYLVVQLAFGLVHWLVVKHGHLWVPAKQLLNENLHYRKTFYFIVSPKMVWKKFSSLVSKLTSSCFLATSPGFLGGFCRAYGENYLY